MDVRARALLSLDGLSVGDAFGETFFGPTDEVCPAIDAQRLAPAPWAWTDDTDMARSIVEVLAELGHIEQDALAARFARRHELEPMRGYGAGAREILARIASGVPWRQAARSAFGGRGSFGNGAAMRVAPLGAWFADDLERCATEAARSAEVTHQHPEGIAGAIAVAVAAALAWTTREAPMEPRTFLKSVAERTPAGYTRMGIEEAIGLADGATVVDAAQVLGNGAGVTAPDTVPLCLWVAARKPKDYEGALWETVRALGDRDTTCAIVGGIVALSAGHESIPREWLARREPWIGA